MILASQPFVVVVQKEQIYGLSLNTASPSLSGMVPIAGLSNAYDVDFDSDQQLLYFVQHPVEGRILKASVVKDVSILVLLVKSNKINEFH